MAAFGFLLILVLAVRKVVGAIIIGVLAVTISAIFFDLIQFNGIISSPPNLKPILFKLDSL